MNSGRQSMRDEASLLTRKDINFTVNCDVIATQRTTEEEWVDKVSNSIKGDSVSNQKLK